MENINLNNVDTMKYLTTKEVSQLLHLSVSHLMHLRMDNFKYGEDGKLKPEYINFIKFGGKILYPLSEVRKTLSRLTSISQGGENEYIKSHFE